MFEKKDKKNFLKDKNNSTFLNKNKSEKRVIFFSIFIMFIFLVLIFRLFQIQILKGKFYINQSRTQNSKISGDNFERGSINFSSKNNVFSPAVENSINYNLILDVKVFLNYIKKNNLDLEKEKENYFNKIDEVLKINNKISINSDSEIQEIEEQKWNKENFFKDLKKENSSYQILAKSLTDESIDNLKKINIPGIFLEKVPKRDYFEKDVAAKVLGYVGLEKINRVGNYGVEKFYNDILFRNNPVEKNFFLEVFEDVKDNINKKDSSYLDKEGDITLTLDVNVSRYLNNALKITKEKWKTEKIGGIIMDINTGEIVAMDELPSFDPNKYAGVDVSYFNNDIVSSSYEFGSIIKPLTVAAALDLNLVDLNTKYNDSGTRTINNRVISNFDKKARGQNTSLQLILTKSLNIGIAFIVEKLGIENFREYFKRYGFGDYTGIDLPSEVKGLVPFNSNILVDYVTSGYGQGINTTPIQTIRALSSLGNGGKLVNPYILKSVRYLNGEESVNSFVEGENIFNNSSTSKTITDILVNVVDSPEGMNAKNPKYSIAAKTGTALLLNNATKKYYEDKYFHSFFGYFPASNPKYIVLLYQINPKGATYASQTLKPLFFELVDYLIKYFEIPPDRDLTKKTI